MRVRGRILRYSTLAERRIFLSLGITSIRVPRNVNPFSTARKVGRLARTETPDSEFLRKLIAQVKAKPPTGPSPEVDTPEPVETTPVVADVRAA